MFIVICMGMDIYVNIVLSRAIDGHSKVTYTESKNFVDQSYCAVLLTADNS